MDDDPRPYHHGDLARAMIDAACEELCDSNPAKLSMRAVARRAGVSPGAPFRHFASKSALLAAVAAEAMGRLTQAVMQAVDDAPADDPVARFHAIGRGYLDWALSNPTYFNIISARDLIDVASTPELFRQNNAIKDMMVGLLAEIRAANRLRTVASDDQIVLSARAFVYGLGRMASDGHFPEWHPSQRPDVAAHDALSLFIQGMFLPPK